MNNVTLRELTLEGAISIIANLEQEKALLNKATNNKMRAMEMVIAGNDSDMVAITQDSFKRINNAKAEVRILKHIIDEMSQTISEDKIDFSTYMEEVKALEDEASKRERVISKLRATILKDFVNSEDEVRQLKNDNLTLKASLKEFDGLVQDMREDYMERAFESVPMLSEKLSRKTRETDHSGTKLIDRRDFKFVKAELPLENVANRQYKQLDLLDV